MIAAEAAAEAAKKAEAQRRAQAAADVRAAARAEKKAENERRAEAAAEVKAARRAQAKARAEEKAQAKAEEKAKADAQDRAEEKAGAEETPTEPASERKGAAGANWVTRVRPGAGNSESAPAESNAPGSASRGRDGAGLLGTPGAPAGPRTDLVPLTSRRPSAEGTTSRNGAPSLGTGGLTP